MKIFVRASTSSQCSLVTLDTSDTFAEICDRISCSAKCSDTVPSLICDGRAVTCLQDLHQYATVTVVTPTLLGGSKVPAAGSTVQSNARKTPDGTVVEQSDMYAMFVVDTEIGSQLLQLGEGLRFSPTEAYVQENEPFVTKKEKNTA